MAAQKIVYLVTSGEHSDYREEAILDTPELAAALVDSLDPSDYPSVVPMPVLDYVPVKVDVTTYHLDLDPITGWEMTKDRYPDNMWDYQAPKVAPQISTHTYAERRGSKVFRVQRIRISHLDETVARRTAEEMLIQLRGAVELEGHDDGPAAS